MRLRRNNSTTVPSRPTAPAAGVPAAGSGEAWFSPGRCALLIGALLVLSFPGVFSGQETFFYRDFGNFAYPAALFHQESFWRGELPLWNPLNYCGIPFLAQWNTLTLYPPALLYLVFPLTWSLGVFCLAHWWFGGLGMYYLARRWTRSAPGATIAAVVFAFNGVSWHCVALPNYLVALGWLPWVLLAVVAVVHRGGAGGRRSIVLTGLAGGMQMLSGAPEVILVTWFCAGVLTLREVIAGTVRGAGITRLLGAGLLVAALAAAQLLPFLQLVGAAQRDAAFGGVGDTQGAMPASGWANYFVPLFHLFRTPQGAWVQRHQVYFGSYYLGLATIALAGLAVARVRDTRWRWLGAVALAGVVLAMGDHGGVYPVLKRLIPPLGMFRFPVKFTLLPVVAAPLLTAAAVGWVLGVGAADWPRARRWLWGAASLAIAVAAGVVAQAWFAPLAGDEPRQVAANAILRAGFLVAVIACLAGLREFDPRDRRQLRNALLLPALFWFDIYTHQPMVGPTITTTVYEPDTVREQFHWTNSMHVGEGRALQGLASMNQLVSTPLPDPVIDFNSRRLCLYSDYNGLDHVPKLDGNFALYPREIHELIARLYTARTEPVPLEDFLGVAQVSDPANPVGWVARTNFLPLVTIGQEPRFESASNALRVVTAPDFQPRAEVLLPIAAARLVVAKRSPDARVLTVTNTQQEITAEVSSPGPAMVVVAQTDYPAWRAEVDGQPAALWRANYAFQALAVPPGKHLVRLYYQDSVFLTGVVVSLLALVGCLVVGRLSPEEPAAVAAAPCHPPSPHV